MNFSASLFDALVGLKYGLRAGIAVAAAVVNDLGFRLTLAIDPESQAMREKTARTAVNFPGMDGLEQSAPPDPNGLALGFTAAQILLLQLIRTPDPDHFGSTNAWATRYMRDGRMLVQNLVDWRSKKEADRLAGERAKLATVGFAVPTPTGTPETSEAIAGRDQLAQQLDQLIAMQYAAIKDSPTEDLYQEIVDAYPGGEPAMMSKVRESLSAIMGAQAKKLSENKGYVSVDAGMVALLKALQPTAPVPTTGS